MKEKILKSTDGDGESITTSNTRYIQFVADMVKAGIPWRSYINPEGQTCPAAETGGGVIVEDIIRATKVKNLNERFKGIVKVIYP